MPNNIIRQDYGDVYSDKATQHMLAPIQTNLVAIKNYDKGENFIYNNELYKAKQAITEGTLMVFDTDFEAAGTLTEELDSAIKAYDDFLSRKTKTITAVNMRGNLAIKSEGTVFNLGTFQLPVGTYTCTEKYISGSNTLYCVPFGTISAADLKFVFPEYSSYIDNDMPQYGALGFGVSLIFDATPKYIGNTGPLFIKRNSSTFAFCVGWFSSSAINNPYTLTSMYTFIGLTDLRPTAISDLLPDPI